MAFVDHVPWHGHGEAVASTVTATEMCRAAGLNWEVTKQPALGARIVNKQRALHDRYLIMRQSVGHEKDAVALGMVGSGYEPLQKTEAFKSGLPIWKPPSPLSVTRNRSTCNSPSNDSHLRADPDD